MPTVQQVYAQMGKETLWQAAHDIHHVLTDTDRPHAIVGGVAVCLHGYQRNTLDIDLLVQRGDSEVLRLDLEASGWTWDADRKEFRNASGIALQLLLSGDKAGSGAEITTPDPADETTVTEIEQLPVVTLPRLIEMKIACGEGSLRRAYKDLGDVVELIAVNGLDASYAGRLHKSVRKTYRELVKRARG